VRHSDDKTLSAHFCARVNRYFKPGNERFASLETKALHSVELLSGEVTELVSPVEAGVKMQLFFWRNFLVLDALKTRSDPVAHLLVSNMHEFNANLAAVGIFVGLYEVLEFPDALFFADTPPILRVHVVLFVEILLGKSIGLVVADVI